VADFLDLKPGHRVQVRPAGARNGRGHDSTVLEIEATTVLIEVPTREGEPLRLRPGDQVHVSLQAHGRRYSFDTAVQSLHDGPQPGVSLEMPSAVAQHDRREFYRLPIMIHPRYAALTDKDGEEVERVELVIADISGGGLRLRAHRWVPVGTRMRLIFDLGDDEDELDALAEAVSVDEDGRRGSYRVNARFVEPSRQLEERIVRFVFSQQVELLQKGVL
jgi:c-di-GMP-binding flagellar brake protein YcgR